MKKKLFVTCVCLILIVTLFACSKNPTQPEENTSSKTDTITTSDTIVSQVENITPENTDWVVINVSWSKTDFKVKQIYSNAMEYVEEKFTPQTYIAYKNDSEIIYAFSVKDEDNNLRDVKIYINKRNNSAERVEISKVNEKLIDFPKLTTDGKLIKEEENTENNIDENDELNSEENINEEINNKFYSLTDAILNKYNSIEKFSEKYSDGFFTVSVKDEKIIYTNINKEQIEKDDVKSYNQAITEYYYEEPDDIIKIIQDLQEDIQYKPVPVVLEYLNNDKSNIVTLEFNESGVKAVE